jgi:catechol 2,3-dioxygenase-like lactoylglutathione lyase family enzyme
MIDRFHHLFIEPSDFEASLAFYRDVLGWTITQTWGEDGAERGAVLSGGGIKVVIAQQPAAAKEGAGSGAHGGRPNVHLDIHDIDARYREIPKGGHVVTEPQDTHWGTRWFVVRDPDGNLIAFEELHRRES